MKRTNKISEIDHNNLYENTMINNTIYNVKPSEKNRSPSISTFTIVHRKFTSSEKFFFIFLILKILQIFNSTNFLLKTNNVLLHSVIISKKLPLHCGLDRNLMLNCKNRDLPKSLFIIKKK